jgi:hypothetical protein
MDELRAQFDWDRGESSHVRQNPTAKTLTCFQDNDMVAVGRQLGCGREAGSARADDHRISLFGYTHTASVLKLIANSNLCACVALALAWHHRAVRHVARKGIILT